MNSNGKIKMENGKWKMEKWNNRQQGATHHIKKVITVWPLGDKKGAGGMLHQDLDFHMEVGPSLGGGVNEGLIQVEHQSLPLLRHWKRACDIKQRRLPPLSAPERERGPVGGVWGDRRESPLIHKWQPGDAPGDNRSAVLVCISMAKAVERQ